MDPESCRSSVCLFIASCEALLGYSLEAMSWLFSAVEAGLNLQLLETHPDIASLRHLDSYKLLLLKAKQPNPVQVASNRPAPKLSCSTLSHHAKFSQLQRDGLNLLRSKVDINVEAARALFEEQLTIFDTLNEIPYMNIASCDAILGRTRDALRNLNEAVNCGWISAERIETNPFFASICHLDEFKAIVRRLKSNTLPSSIPVSTSKSPSVVTAPVTVPPAKPSALNPPSSVTPTAPIVSPTVAPTATVVTTLDALLGTLSDMGFNNKTANFQALQLADGDIVKAVQLLVLS